jgi:hypothetical protein
MARLARPGGWVASMEPDTEHGRCYPPHPAFDRLCDIFTVAFRRNGADPWIGRRVPELFRRAGLEDVQVEARVQRPNSTVDKVRAQFLPWPLARAIHSHRAGAIRPMTITTVMMSGSSGCGPIPDPNASTSVGGSLTGASRG